MGRRVIIPTAELKRLHERYERAAFAKQPRVINRLAQEIGIDPSTLLERFRKHGLPTLNIKPNKRTYGDDQFRKWHAEYVAGATTKDLAEKYHVSSTTLCAEFRRLGLKTRTRQEYLSHPRKTEMEIAALIERQATQARGPNQSAVTVPKELKHEWRGWPLERRADFIRRLRARLNTGRDMPTTPHSANVEPFDYGSEAAWKIANAANEGLPSRDWKVRLFPCAQGMIHRGVLYFWVSNEPESRGGIYISGSGGPYQPSSRKLLHQVIWREAHGEIPASHVVRVKDGNPNNLAPQNLYLQSRADEASENRRNVRIKKSRELTALLLQRHERKQNHEHTNDKLIGHLVAQSGRRGPTGRTRPDQRPRPRAKNAVAAG